uniref:CCHC-type domain-containing protein n=1 Tax=Heliothis virescens TaxID=7102 RepID=A0A2A4JJP2_HELVI
MPLSKQSPPPPEGLTAQRTESLPTLGVVQLDTPLRPLLAWQEVERRKKNKWEPAPASSAQLAVAVPAPGPTVPAPPAARRTVPRRPSAFRPVPAQEPGPATVGRAQRTPRPARTAYAVQPEDIAEPHLHHTQVYSRTGSATPHRIWFTQASPATPRTSARDSPAVRPANLSRSGSEMSVASGYDDVYEADYSPVGSPSPPPARAQRRQREEEEDEEAEAVALSKRYCHEDTPPPSFAEVTRRYTPSPTAMDVPQGVEEDVAAAAATPPPSQPMRKTARYPPLVVERMPDWAAHFRVLRQRLGFPPHARPYQGGVRFKPETEEEYRVVQRYLTTLEAESGLSWFAYSLPAERSVKVAIRGLPAETDPQEILEELQGLGYRPEHVRHIKARHGRPGCVFHAVLQRTPDFHTLYNTDILLNMRGVRIEAWRSKRGPAQCHRCQKFRHSSHHCHRPLACVRCGEGHHARDCPRPREAPPTCANCGGEHPACSVRCPAFIREARNRRAGTVAETLPRLRPEAPPQEADAPSSLMAAANGPPQQASHTAPKRRRRGKRGGKRGKEPQVAAAQPTPTTVSAPTTAQAPAHAAAATGPGQSTAAVARTGAGSAISTLPPQPRRQQGSAGAHTRASKTASAIQILLGVIKALREGSNPEEAVLDGLTAVLAIYGGYAVEEHTTDRPWPAEQGHLPLRAASHKRCPSGCLARCKGQSKDLPVLTGSGVPRGKGASPRGPPAAPPDGGAATAHRSSVSLLGLLAKIKV